MVARNKNNSVEPQRGASMARLRKPTEVLKLAVTFLDNPTRRRLPGPTSELPIGGPPEHLAPHEATAWREFVANAPAGVLTGGNRWVLEMACRLIAKSRREGLLAAETGYLRACLTALGVSPASHSGVPGARPAAVSAASSWDVPGPARN
jgi:hypothetical protein